jgi:hypothetical protein
MSATQEESESKHRAHCPADRRAREGLRKPRQELAEPAGGRSLSDPEFPERAVLRRSTTANPATAASAYSAIWFCRSVWGAAPRDRLGTQFQNRISSCEPSAGRMSGHFSDRWRLPPRRQPVHCKAAHGLSLERLSWPAPGQQLLPARRLRPARTTRHPRHASHFARPSTGPGRPSPRTARLSQVSPGQTWRPSEGQQPLLSAFPGNRYRFPTGALRRAR